MRRRSPAFAAKSLQLFGLLVAFVLLVAAKDFASAHPALSALLVFVFSLPYLGAALVTKQAHFLYGLMLLGATSYFLACHALGAPGSSFPLLSVPLVACLLMVGRHLERILPEGQQSFPQTVYRAMHITVAVFAIWALGDAPELISSGTLLRYVPSMTFIGYAGVYLVHGVSRTSPVTTYVFSLFLVLGAVFCGGTLWSLSSSWAPMLVASALIVFAGTRFHREKTFRWSRHFYFSFAAALSLALLFSVLHLSSFVLALGIASLILWTAYHWLGRAVGSVRGASTAERGTARCFSLGAAALSAPMLPLILIYPGSPSISAASLIFALTFAWIARERMDDRTGGRSLYTLGALLFLSTGLLGIGRTLPGWSASAWSLVIPTAALIGLGLLHGIADRAGKGGPARSLAEGAVFPALLAWHIPLVEGQALVALLAAVITLGVVLALGRFLTNAVFIYYALGPAAAGVLVAVATLWGGHSAAAWAACAAAAGLAGAYFTWTDPQKSPALRGAANLAWVILSFAAAIVAGFCGAAHLLVCTTIIGCIAVVMGLRKAKEREGDIFDLFVSIVAWLATIVTVVLGPFTVLGPVGAGASLLLLAAAHILAWVSAGGLSHARVGLGLFALGALLIIFGTVSGVDIRLALGAVAVLALFVAAAAFRVRSPEAAHSAGMVGHMTSIVLALAALIQAWPQGTALLPVAAALFVVLYTATPRLRGDAGFRLGAAGWLSILVLFTLASATGESYREHIPLVTLLSLVWLILGYALRAKASSWSMPLYICAALLAVFCGIVSLFSPATGVPPGIGTM